MFNNTNISVTGYIAHMMHKRLDVAYMTYAVCFLLGHFIMFASGFIFDVHGVQWVMIVFVSGSLPLYLIAEWLHKHLKHASVNSKVQNLHCYKLVVSYASMNTEQPTLSYKAYRCITVQTTLPSSHVFLLGLSCKGPLSHNTLHTSIFKCLHYLIASP